MPDASHLKQYQFTSANQPKNRGRKPSILKKYIKDNGISSEDIKNCYRHILGLDREKLQEILQDPKSSALIATVASAVLQDMKKGKLGNIDNILNKANVNPAGDLSGESNGAIGAPDIDARSQFHEYSFPEAEKLP